MSQNEQIDPLVDWQCGGWEGAERETHRIMREMTFEQKLVWLEEAQQLVADMHGWDTALLPGGTPFKPKPRPREQD